MKIFTRLIRLKLNNMSNQRKQHHVMLFIYTVLSFSALGVWLIYRVLTDNIAVASGF